MKTLFDPEAAKEVVARINNLSPGSTALWGKMKVDQMLAHCTRGLEMGTGDQNLPRPFIGRLIGGLLRSVYSNDKPFHRNSPTAPYLTVTDPRDFEQEKQKLFAIIQRFQTGGESKCTTHPHPFFGKLTPREWGIGMYKHLDHHLNQFGV